jgi:hypothetical protein
VLPNEDLENGPSGQDLFELGGDPEEQVLAAVNQMETLSSFASLKERIHKLGAIEAYPGRSHTRGRPQTFLDIFIASCFSSGKYGSAMYRINALPRRTTKLRRSS